MPSVLVDFKQVIPYTKECNMGWQELCIFDSIDKFSDEQELESTVLHGVFGQVVSSSRGIF